MWKRDDAVKPTAPAGTGPAQVQNANVNAPAPEPVRSINEPPRGMERGTVNIGKSVVIKGELSGSEDLTIEGHVEGKIELRQNVLTIGPNGKIKAQVFAKAVIILGEVTGNVTASEKVDIRDNGSVDGDIAAPRVAIAEGAHFRGSIDMQRSGGGATVPGKVEGKAEGKPDGKTEAKTEGKPQTAAPPPQPAPAGAR
jgi:cytoskeletal protein CcmA (bactofilin family)